MEELMNIETWTPWLIKIVAAIAILFIGSMIRKIVESIAKKALGKSDLGVSLIGFLSSLAGYAVLAIAIIAALDKIGIQTTSIVAIFASAGLAIALALKDNFSNLASGVMILFFKPFEIGNRVTVNGSTGTVTDIGLFVTTLITPDRERIFVGNSAVTGNTITNHNVEPVVRGSIDVGVAYGSNVDEVMAILVDAAKSVAPALKDPAPHVAFLQMGASSLDFRVFAYAEPKNLLEVKHLLNKAVYNKLNEANIDIPFNQLVIHNAE